MYLSAIATFICHIEIAQNAQNTILDVHNTQSGIVFDKCHKNERC